jgi:hypothetical protein
MQNQWMRRALNQFLSSKHFEPIPFLKEHQWFGSGQFDFLEEIRSGWVGSIYMLCFFRSLIDFDWIEGHLISDRVGSSRVRVGSYPDGSDRFLESDRVLPPLSTTPLQNAIHTYLLTFGK